ncbi:Transposase DDE domain protein [Aquisphaera giovannonii]|uniref:Transposase DDE domain protein n=1 Tax=Aquisphaera giovannonii TaxID=406548 RepID=A0A5B9WEC5_9BACT|nr:IS5 family transposase [Aquisphaera giovannonii]QEH38932.1 Transposase DDE domain protein [Aquisphaera giovannonii]
MRRYELSDAQYAEVKPLLPDPRHHGKGGRPWLPHRAMVDGILWILKTGAPWRDLPERYGKWNSVYARFNRWRRDGTWSRILSKTLDRRDARGEIDHDLWCIDGTVVRAARCAGGARRRNRRRPRLGGSAATRLDEPEDHALGYSRGGFGTKVHLLCDGRGTVLGIYATPGQRHESRAFEPTMRRVYLPGRRGRPRWPRRLAGDKGYSYPGIWRWLSRRRIGRVIPTRKDQPRAADFDKDTYRKRNIIERVVGWYKECRRLLTRLGKRLESGWEIP